MSEITSPCTLDTFLQSLPKADREALQPITEMLGLRHAFVTHPVDAPGMSEAGVEAALLSASHLVPVRKLPGGRPGALWALRMVPLALVLSVALREEQDGLELQLDLYESSPIVLRWSGVSLAGIVEDKAFQLLMSTCGFSTTAPERSGRVGFRGLG